MSFVKIPRKYYNRSHCGHNTKRKKNIPGWDDTINDLSVYKATAEELERRKEVTTSKNIDLVQADKIKRNISRASRNSSRTPGKRRQNALMREVLYDSSQLSDVLNKTDKMMAVVQDLFGDDPMKYKGLPNVTTAPHMYGNDSTLPGDVQRRLKLDILSDSIMDKSALNDSNYDDDDEDEFESIESDGDNPSYKPQLDFDRFQQLLRRAEGELEKEKQQGLGKGGRNRGTVTASMTDKMLEDLAARLGVNTENGRVTPITAVESFQATPHSHGAINDTLKVKKTKSRLTEEERSVSTFNSSGNDGDHSNLDNLRQVLDGLEQNIGQYENLTGRQCSNVPNKEESNTLTGFTGRLVTAVNKVSRYLKENELRLRAESLLREQQGEDIVGLKTLVDTLTTDIIATQEQYVALQSEFVKYRKETAGQLAAIKQGLQLRGIETHPIVQPIPEMATLMTSVHREIYQHHNIQAQQQQLSQHINSTVSIGEHARDTLSQISKQQEHIQHHDLYYPKPITPATQFPGVSSYQNQRQQQMMSQNEDESNLAQHLANRLRLSSMESNGTVGSSVPLAAPRQTNSPKVQGKVSSRVNDADRDYDLLQQSLQAASNKQYSQLSQSQYSDNFSQPFQKPSQQQQGNHHFSGEPGYIDSDQLPHTASTSMGITVGSTSAFQPPVTTRNNMVPVSVLARNQNINILQQNLTAEQHPELLYPDRAVTRHLDENINRYRNLNNSDGVVNQSNQPYSTSSLPVNPVSAIPVTHQPRQLPSGYQNGANRNAGRGVDAHISSNLERQIEELNRQHSEAQSKLEMLLHQQETVEEKLTSRKNVPVSPPISPITVDSDVECSLPLRHQPYQQNVHKKVPTKEIKIALPRVENIIELQSQ